MSDPATTFVLLAPANATQSHLADLDSSAILCGAVTTGAIAMHGIVGPDASSCAICRRLAPFHPATDIETVIELSDDAIDELGRRRFVTHWIGYNPNSQHHRAHRAQVSHADPTKHVAKLEERHRPVRVLDAHGSPATL